MTLENLNYRTNPMFLRNQFPALNAYGIPEIPKAEFNDEELKELRLLAFNQTKSDNGSITNVLSTSFYMIITYMPILRCYL